MDLSQLPFTKVRNKQQYKCFKDFKVWILFSNGVQLCASVQKGYIFDGASVPSGLQHLPCVPKGYYTGKNSAIKNVGGLIHDILYGWRGRAGSIVLSADECDQLLCDIWQYTINTSDFICKCAKVALKVVAHREGHWGADQYLCNEKACVRVIER